MIAAVLVAAAGAACRRDAPKREVVPPAVLTPAPAAAAMAPSGCGLAPEAWRFPAVPRIVTFGDVHGDLSAAQAVLRLAGAVDDQGAWIGGALWIVQTGDILDRGPDEQAIIDWFERLEGEARAAGGRFVWLLGNHELMNAAGDLRYVTPAGMHDFDDAPGLALDRFAAQPAEVRGRLAALTPGGPYAQILSGQNYVAIVGDTVFVHGGIRAEWAPKLDGDTLAARCWLAGQGPPPEALDSQTSPVWDRSFATAAVDCAKLDQALAAIGVARMVVGHTVQDGGITSACGDKIWRIDVGLAQAYGGPREALELTGPTARILRP